jgi:hypothetical protein
LSVLDAQRAKAYATGDAALLRKVYVPGPLLTADTALLRRIVPGGCGLAGARTSYSAVRAVPNGNGVVVTATATLSPSQLLCDGHRRGAAPGAGPTTLRLELINTAAGPRIADQREV